MAKVLATDECTRKLFRLIQRYDIDELLVAATRRTPQGWPVISNDEKRGIEKLGGSRKQKLDRLITLVAKSAERMTRFAVFIKWYTSSIEEAADDVLGYQDSPGAVATQSMKKPETVTNSRVLKDAYEKTLVAEQRSHQKSFTDSLSSAARRATVHDRFVDTGLTANSQEQYPMETPVRIA